MWSYVQYTIDNYPLIYTIMLGYIQIPMRSQKIFFSIPDS